MKNSLFLLAALTLPLTAQTYQRGTTTADLARRDPAIHWPKAFDPSSAHLFSHNELLIHANCPRVFTRLTDLTDWPNQVVFIKNVEIVGPDKTVKEGAVAHLTIFNTPIETRITEFVPNSRLAWLPRTLTEPEPGHYHAWHLTPEGAGCRVVTEETGITAQDAKLAAAGNTFMHRAHDLWLASLKWASEQ